MTTTPTKKRRQAKHQGDECPRCHGTGEFTDHDLRTTVCGRCSGSGFLEKHPATYDWHDNELGIGDRVKCETPHGLEFGTITEITDWDADVDDYGRPMPLYPTIYVLFDGSDNPEGLTTQYRGGYGPNADGSVVCEDVDLAVTP